MTQTTNDPDIKILRESLDAICDQLPNGANLNPAARIMSVLSKIEARLEASSDLARAINIWSANVKI